jgi:hypothetical protein
VVQLDNADSQLAAAATGDELANVNNVIAGSGTIGTGGLVLDNQAAGVIDADGASLLIINTAGQGVSNEGFIESTGGAGLQITGGTTVTNTGSILADGGNVYLDNATIDGGTLGSPGGSFVVDTGDTATLSAVSLAAGTQIAVSDMATLDLFGGTSGGATITVAGSNATLVLGAQEPSFLPATAAAVPAPDSWTTGGAHAAGAMLLDGYHAPPSLPAHHAGGF